MISVWQVRTAVALSVCVWLGSALLAQRGDAAPPRAAIIGIVIDQLTGAGVEDVIVQARGGSFMDFASTDASGRFVLNGNFPASVDLTASSERRGSVVQGSGAFGQTRWDGEARTISISPGQTLQNVTIPFWPAAIVTGRVTDDDGAPVVGARVHVLDRAADAGRRRLLDVSVMDGVLTFTDEDGRYRFLHEPGPVYLRASSAELRTPTVVGSGRAKALAFRPAFAPGVATVAEARPILLDPARQHVVDLVLHREPSFSIEGVVSDERGPVIGVRVSWAESGTSESDDRLTTMTDSAGRFAIQGLVAGDYTLTAEQWNVNTRKRKSARYRVSVVDRSLAISVTLRRDPIMRGRYVFAGSSGPPRNVPSDFGLVTDAAVRRWSWERMRLISEPEPRPTNFAIDVEPGRRVVRLEGAPDGWMVRSIMMESRDITHSAFDVTADVSDVVVTLTDRVTDVRGHLTDGVIRNGGWTEGIWIFPSDPNRWVDFGPAPPDIRQIWFDESQNFSEEGLSPGDYLIAQLPAGRLSGPPDASVLRSASATAIKVSIAVGQRVTVSLTSMAIGRGPRGSMPWAVDPLPRTRAELPVVLAPINRGAQTSTIRGRVLPSADAPSSRNTVVHLIPSPPSIDITDYVDVQAAGLAGALTVADADGRFVFEGVAPGAYVLRARNSTFGLVSNPVRRPYVDPSIVVRAGVVNPEIQIPMSPVATLSIVARDERGRVIPSVRVMLDTRMPIPGEWTPRLEGKTNDRGECVFLGVEPGTYNVSVSAYRGPNRATLAADFDDPLKADLPRFQNRDGVGAALDAVSLKPGERRVMNVALRLATIDR